MFIPSSNGALVEVNVNISCEGPSMGVIGGETVYSLMDLLYAMSQLLPSQHSLHIFSLHAYCWHLERWFPLFVQAEQQMVACMIIAVSSLRCAGDFNGAQGG